MISKVKTLLFPLTPGILLAAAIAVPSIIIHSYYKPLSAVAVAIVTGLLIRNLLGLPAACQVGNQFAVKKVLKFAIILLGVRLSFLDIVKIGGSSLVIIISCIIISLVLAQFLTSLFGLPKRLGTLIGVGTCICGNSAIVATAPAINAEDEEIAFAVATITLFGILAIFIFPVLGNLLSMTNTAFGTWAGTAINDTSGVVTAGYIFSDESGNVATVIKLIRNLFIAPAILIISFWYSRQDDNTTPKGKVNYKKTFPLFVFGFVLMAVLRTLNIFPESVILIINKTAIYLIVLCIASVGLGTNFGTMKKIGLKPFYVGLSVSLVMMATSYLLIKVLSLG